MDDKQHCLGLGLMTAETKDIHRVNCCNQSEENPHEERGWRVRAKCRCARQWKEILLLGFN